MWICPVQRAGNSRHLALFVRDVTVDLGRGVQAQQRLGWHATEPGMVAGLEQMHSF